MPVDLALLRAEAELLRKEWDDDKWDASERLFEHQRPKSNPGAVAERCIALIASVEAALRVCDDLIEEVNDPAVRPSIATEAYEFTAKIRKVLKGAQP